MEEPWGSALGGDLRQIAQHHLETPSPRGTYIPLMSATKNFGPNDNTFELRIFGFVFGSKKFLRWASLVSARQSAQVPTSLQREFPGCHKRFGQFDNVIHDHGDWVIGFVKGLS